MSSIIFLTLSSVVSIKTLLSSPNNKVDVISTNRVIVEPIK